MDPEKKVEEKAQTPVQPVTKTEEKKPEEKKVSGLDQLTVEDLKDFYKKSPQMFKEAGLTQEKQEEKKEVKQPETKPQSAAPVAKYRDVDIKLPTDVEINADAIKPHFDHWAEMGHSPEQVQKEVDFMAKTVREEKKKREEISRKQETPAELAKREDAANVGVLKADPEFGKDFDKNMEISRRAALRHGNKDMLARMATSDPVLVKHFWDLGKLDTEDHTIRGLPRTGDEEREKLGNDPKSEPVLKKRFPNTPQMFK